MPTHQICENTSHPQPHYKVQLLSNFTATTWPTACSNNQTNFRNKVCEQSIIRILFFWDMMQHHWVIGSQCFETTSQPHLWGLKCPRRWTIHAWNFKTTKRPYLQRLNHPWAFFSDILTIDDKTTMLYWHIKNQLPTDAAWYARRMDSSAKMLQKCENSQSCYAT